MNTTTQTAPETTTIHAARVLWDAHYAALSGVRRDIDRSIMITIDKSCAEEDAERAALAEVEAKIAALGGRP